jgi:hypothetical protein
MLLRIVQASDKYFFLKKNEMPSLRKPVVYKLFPLSQKPDSVNLFMANKRIARKLNRLDHNRHRPPVTGVKGVL